MIPCHSAIGRPYFFSMDGKYDAGPCFGQGVPCSAMRMLSFRLRLYDERDARISSLIP
jgi:hypothetical protein